MLRRRKQFCIQALKESLYYRLTQFWGIVNKMKQDMQSLKISRILEPVDSLVIFLNWLNSVLGTFLLIVINI